jgi:hypothetical protein
MGVQLMLSPYTRALVFWLSLVVGLALIRLGRLDEARSVLTDSRARSLAADQLGPDRGDTPTAHGLLQDLPEADPDD